MPLPEWRKRIPGKQSIQKEAVAAIINMEFTNVFGPPGASAQFTHGLVTPDKPLGNPPRKDTTSGNRGISKERYGKAEDAAPVWRDE